ncbi:HAD-IIB family hydrolase [Tropicimonas sp. IMCC34011]|uniref:HAD-IIB family hydrolase n=1 Tax=Tropicimonas sp. IMCC34011 TaxID=2248759 RepID=UPI000E2707B0|nr:HAD-IIB family hydrolase [Tropicimonas sp. IMCC34011]
MTDLTTREFVLATDLDGTFLGGTDEARAALYEWIDANRDSVGLVFVTGRDPEFIVDLTRGTPIPTPDYVVGDVGTTIARVVDGQVEPIAELEEEIARTWGDAGPRVRQALDGHPGLTVQDTEFRYRVSFDMDPETYDDSAALKVSEMGFDPLISANRYFDVLPRGISKGPSIRRLVSHLGVEERRVLCAGDTLNDLSMLVCGLPAVAVGNSEAPLLEALPEDAPHIWRAKADGCAGIWEAIAAFGLHSQARETPNAL